jgi:hypothetical protein
MPSLTIRQPTLGFGTDAGRPRRDSAMATAIQSASAGGRRI